MKNLVSMMLVVLCLTATGDPAKLGSLTRDSDVMTEGIYPVFQIWVPEGVTEVQIRASVNNFQNSFRLVKTGVNALDLTYRCLGTRNGKNYYKVDGTYGAVCYWDPNGWFFTANELRIASTAEFPWLCAFPSGYTATELDADDKFVYRWCSTGQGADVTWGTGVSDGAAKLYFANQKGTMGATSRSPQRLQYWLGNTGEHPSGTSMTAQLQPTGTPGRFVIFQPSRSSHLLSGFNGDWMRQANNHLQWVVQFETVGGWEHHPDGSQLWNAIRPIEWRAARLELQESK